MFAVRFGFPNMSLKKSSTSIAADELNAIDIINSLSIPPQPVVLQQMQTEMGKSDPDVRKAAHIVSQDVGLTVAVLKTVNSPLYGLPRKAASVEQAVGLIGLKQLSALVTAISVRLVLKGDAQTLARFYASSSKRSFALARMAKKVQGLEPTLAQMFGLFCDVAIPLLVSRFPDYPKTLRVAEAEKERTFTAVEHAHHHTDHALIGALMAKTWGLPHNVCLAIRMHHDYEIFLDPKVPRDICAMVALGLVADAAIHRHSGSTSTEWVKGCDYVPGALVWSPTEVEEHIDQLLEDFAAGVD